MGRHTSELWQLAFELLDYPTLQQLRNVATTRPLNLQALLDLDRRISGPGIYNVNDMNGGCYQGADEEIFRPLQSCYRIFQADPLSLDMLARDVVRMMGLHIDTLVKQASGRWLGWLPLGQALRQGAIKDRVDVLAWDQLVRYTTCTNDARTVLLHSTERELFSVEDAVVAYIVGRKVAEALYPLVDLHTPVRAFYLSRCASAWTQA
jgi:hypothetical protein